MQLVGTDDEYDGNDEDDDIDWLDPSSSESELNIFDLSEGENDDAGDNIDEEEDENEVEGYVEDIDENIDDLEDSAQWTTDDDDENAAY